ncbi:MAG TPA: M4 family metallopeptidase [Holophagaceae bacterium]|nr:M4 family metallopeptidase [Holophagaceae bacterium]
MANLRLSLPSLALALAAGPLAAQAPLRAPELVEQLRAQETSRIEASHAQLRADRAALGLDALNDLTPLRAHTDELGFTHTRFQQTYQGVKVFGGEIITHMNAEGGLQPHTTAHLQGIRLNPVPSMDASEALAVAHRDLAPKGEYAFAPTVELVVVPETEMVAVVKGPRGLDQERTTSVAERVVRFTLAYHVHTELENGTEETAHTDYLINAHTGGILRKWSTLQTTAATGSGKSQYNGTVSISTNSISGGYELRDNVRSMQFTTRNLNHATSGTGSIYTDADNTWGDSANYVEGSSTTAANGQTAGVDAHYGSMKTFDMYKNVFGRNGINGAGKATYNRVHYSNSYDNAFWSDSCFCMTYGDGNVFKTLTALDVAGHEMTHGVTANSAGLNYSGESGGLNESMSDIFGTMAEFYAKGGGSTSIPTSGGNWTIGEQLRSTPLRYMYKPSLDGASKDAWSSSLGSLDVHYSSGPMNRCFYFLSQGASSSSSSSTYSSYLPGGMTGIGNTAAAKIVYRALTVYMTSSTNYAGAKTACQKAATDLYGSSSAQYAAVTNAFKAINR